MAVIIWVGDNVFEVYNNGEVKVSGLKDYKELINQFNVERYFPGHDFPDSKVGVGELVSTGYFDDGKMKNGYY